MIRFDGKVLLITGGASGIGLATAREAHALGARVAIASRRADRGEEVAAAMGPDAFFVPTDVNREDDVGQLMAVVAERFGRLDALINNAGAIRRTPVHEEDAAGWDKAVGVNLRGVFFCCKHALPALIAAKGSIVNVASILALRANYGRTPAYDAAKAGVVALTRSIAVRYGPEGVRANAVCPDFVPTDLNRNLWETWAPDQWTRSAENYPLRRLGTPEDVARAILFLASDAAAWISGIALVLDGGRAAG